MTKHSYNKDTETLTVNLRGDEDNWEEFTIYELRTIRDAFGNVSRRELFEILDGYAYSK